MLYYIIIINMFVVVMCVYIYIYMIVYIYIYTYTYIYIILYVNTYIGAPRTPWRTPPRIYYLFVLY